MFLYELMQMILYGVGNEISSSTNTLQHLPQPPTDTGGSRNIRHGSMTDRARIGKIPLLETSLKCPRCESTNTKFCYFNNYSLTQPRHFCKSCRRYWTRGGALRNVPVGGDYKRAKKRSGIKRSKSLDVSGTATKTTTTSTDHQNGNNDNGVLQFQSNPNLNQMVHEFSDHYISEGSNYSGSYIDPHIAKLFQTNVITLTNSSMDHQWSKLSEITPFLTSNSSQPFGLGYDQFNQFSNQPRLTKRSSQVDAFGNNSNINAVMSIMDDEIGLKRLLELQALEGSDDHTSIVNKDWRHMD